MVPNFNFLHSKTLTADMFSKKNPSSGHRPLGLLIKTFYQALQAIHDDYAAGKAVPSGFLNKKEELVPEPGDECCISNNALKVLTKHCNAICNFALALMVGTHFNSIYVIFSLLLLLL